MSQEEPTILNITYGDYDATKFIRLGVPLCEETKARFSIQLKYKNFEVTDMVKKKVLDTKAAKAVLSLATYPYKVTINFAGQWGVYATVIITQIHEDDSNENIFTFVLRAIEVDE